MSIAICIHNFNEQCGDKEPSDSLKTTTHQAPGNRVEASKSGLEFRLCKSVSNLVPHRQISLIKDLI